MPGEVLNPLSRLAATSHVCQFKLIKIKYNLKFRSLVSLATFLVRDGQRWLEPVLLGRCRYRAFLSSQKVLLCGAVLNVGCASLPQLLWEIRTACVAAFRVRSLRH